MFGSGNGSIRSLMLQPLSVCPKSTAHRLIVARLQTPAATSTTLSPSVESQPTALSPGVHNCASNAEEDVSAEDKYLSSDGKGDPATAESALGCEHCADRPFVEFVTPLGNGTSLTFGEALVLIMEYTIKEGLLWTAIEKLLKLQNKLLGTNNLPESKYLFRQFAGTSADKVSFHFYCPKCETHLGKTAGGLKERDIWFTCSPCAERYLGKDLIVHR